jgi:sucrose phosphorylase
MRFFPCEILERLLRRLQTLYGKEVAPRLLQRLTLIADRYHAGAGLLPAARGNPWDQGDSMLITYADMVRNPPTAPLTTLRGFLRRHLTGTFTSVHILPFFPSSSDGGFAVIDYRQVAPELGGWEDVRAIARDFKLMFDLVLNHSSSQSAWFRDYQSGIAPARDYFIAVEPDTDLGAVVRPRTTPLLTHTDTPYGERWVWTTFGPDQVDLNFANQDVLFEFLDIVLYYVKNGARVIRLDAVAYLWKDIGTPCINLPQTHEVIKLLRSFLDLVAPETLLLTETNLPHEQNETYFGDGDEAQLIYQFSLPPLLLHALLSGTAKYLVEWLRSLGPTPPGCTHLNFTASHDGIGVRPLEGLLPADEISALAAGVQARGGFVSTRAVPHREESPYELNITYFDALSQPGETDVERQIARFLCSQTIMLALRGIPAVYFHSLTASHNDQAGVASSGHPRSINRHRWDEHELERLLADPDSVTARVFGEYVRLLGLRAAHTAFHPDGPQRVLDLPEGLFGIERTAPDGRERILSVSNLTDEQRTLDHKALRPKDRKSSTRKTCKELIGGGVIHLGREASETLKPYQTLWLQTIA